MSGCESWTIKKAQCQRIDAFKLWCWRRLLRVPWTARKLTLNAGLMLKLKLQCFNHLMWRTNSLEKTLMLGKIEGRRRRGWQRMRWLDGLINWMDMSVSKLQEMVKDREPWSPAGYGAAKSQTWLSNWMPQIRHKATVIRDKDSMELWKQKNINVYWLNYGSM